MRTLTSGVEFWIFDGDTSMVAPEMPIRPRIVLAALCTSDALAPGTMPFLAPSYSAFSTEWRIIDTRQNSKAAKKKKNNKPEVKAISTMVTPLLAAADRTADLRW